MSSGLKSRNFPFTIVLTAGQRRTVHQIGASFFLSSNSLTATDVQIGIDNDHVRAWPVGYRYVEPVGSTFEKIKLYNPSAFAMTVTFWVSLGVINDERTTVSGTVDVDLTPNTITSNPAQLVALPDTMLIDNAAAVNVGGGVVGIPVTNNPFATGESVVIANTVNYDGTYTVLGSSGANQVDITVAFNAENFDGVDDSIGLSVPRSIAADADRKEIIVYNSDAAEIVWWGDTNVNGDNLLGCPIPPQEAIVISTNSAIYFCAENSAGVAGVSLSYNDMTKV